MPVLTKDFGLPDLKLSLPSTDRGRQEIRLPNLDLPRINPPDIDLQRAMSSVDLSKIGTAPREAGKAIAEAISSVELRPRKRRGARRLAAVGLIAAGLAGWVVLTNEEVRARLTAAIRSIRERISTWLADMRGPAWDAVEPVAFTAAETEPIQDSTYGPDTNRGTPDYPDGLGMGNDGNTASETPRATVSS